MDVGKIVHLWNVNRFIANLHAPQSRNLQTFYIQCCKQLSAGTQLPNQNFGAATMCSHCGSLWNTVDYQLRISKGRPISKSVRKLIRSVNVADKKIPKIRATLGKKCIKNQKNKLVIKCSICSMNTEILLSKPKKEKVEKMKITKTDQIQSSQKRRKKRTKDKTAGLNISSTPTSHVENDIKRFKETTARRTGCTTNFITPTQKLKKLNIGRLKDIVKQGVTPPKRKNLHNFLTELC